jgi:imidazolonepropionase-like amidohydrolase
LDPDWPTINLRDAIDNGLVHGPRLIVAAHMISATGGHGDMQSGLSMPMPSRAFEGRGFAREDS